MRSRIAWPFAEPVGLPRAALHQILDRRRIAVSDHRDLMTGLQQVGRHAVAHESGADEADLHLKDLPKGCAPGVSGKAHGGRWQPRRCHYTRDRTVAGEPSTKESQAAFDLVSRAAGL
jgi:hypothetical protein